MSLQINQKRKRTLCKVTKRHIWTRSISTIGRKQINRLCRFFDNRQTAFQCCFVALPPGKAANGETNSKMMKVSHIILANILFGHSPSYYFQKKPNKTKVVAKTWTATGERTQCERSGIWHSISINQTKGLTLILSISRFHRNPEGVEPLESSRLCVAKGKYCLNSNWYRRRRRKNWLLDERQEIRNEKQSEAVLNRTRIVQHPVCMQIVVIIWIFAL